MGGAASQTDEYQRAIDAEGSRLEKDESDLVFVQAILRTRYGITVDDFAQTLDQTIRRKVTSEAPALECLSIADIPTVALRWLWPAHIPAGKLSLLVGDPGVGKSVLSLEIAARVTLGASFPGCPDPKLRNPPANVLLLSAEDDTADTIRPRLEAVGADLERIFVVRSRKGLSLIDDLDALRDFVSPEVALIIIDPISAYMGDTDSHVNSAVRAVLAPVAQLAAETGAAVLAISHLNKGSMSAIYRVAGSIAFAAAARAVWAVAKDPKDDSGQRRLLLPIKCNLARDTAGFQFWVEDQRGQPALRWGEQIIEDATTALQADREDRSSMAEAEEFLRKLLVDGPVYAKEGEAAARANMISSSTLNRARKEVGVVAFKAGSVWVWRLPTDTRLILEQAENGGNGQGELDPEMLHAGAKGRAS